MHGEFNKKSNPATKIHVVIIKRLECVTFSLLKPSEAYVRQDTNHQWLR